MTRAELKAMGVRVRGRVLVDGPHPDMGWYVAVGDYWKPIAYPFPTRRAAEEYARQIRKAMRGDP